MRLSGKAMNSSYRWRLQPASLLLCLLLVAGGPGMAQSGTLRERLSLNEGWRFFLYKGAPDSLVYEERPAVHTSNDGKVADTRPEESATATTSGRALKPWVLPTANDFIKDPAQRHQRPQGHPGKDFPFVQERFNDAGWELLNLPHDWAIKGPFYTGDDAPVGGGMGRLPIQGTAWYRKKITIPAGDRGRSIYLDIDGAMSYAMVWINGKLAGGWPYGYSSFRVDLTPYVTYGAVNQLAIRLDNPLASSRWYPGAGIYRNLWLTKTNAIQVTQWGSFIRSRNVTTAAADIDLDLTIKNKSDKPASLEIRTEIFALDASGKRTATPVAHFDKALLQLVAGEKNTIHRSLQLRHPRLWGPPPAQQPNRYLAVSYVYQKGVELDRYETVFGIRALEFHSEKGLLVNGQPVRFQGVNQHHDLGALGAAFNTRAAERQLEILAEMGCNAIRLAHNPPAPELLELTDRMGFLVIDESFDCWEKGKNPLDFHLIFPDWYEADTRAMVRRDRNHPSVIAWSFGNEVGEQYTGEAGAAWAEKLRGIVLDEDPTRPATASMNYAKPDMPFPAAMDIISLNYQGEGIRDAPAYAHLRGIRTNPLYPAFHGKFPGKLIVSSETASTLSSRGVYLFPVVSGNSAPASDSTGGDPVRQQVSAYDLYTAAFGASPDKVFASQDRHPYVAGEFVWSGWDYLGEPTPYYGARSSYCGIIDLAGFPKDRFYLYQSRWRPGLPMAHLLPHWTWPGREGQITPVHLYTSGDEAELFLNGLSLGRRKKGDFEYRLRWNSVRYAPGVLHVVVYKNGQPWAGDTIRTAGAPTAMRIRADRQTITADGQDLVFATVQVLDEKGIPVPEAATGIRFSVEGPAEIIATDNGDPADFTSFASTRRNCFNGWVLVVLRSQKNKRGDIRLHAEAAGMQPVQVNIKSR